MSTHQLYTLQVEMLTNGITDPYTTPYRTRGLYFHQLSSFITDWVPNYGTVILSRLTDPTNADHTATIGKYRFTLIGE